MLGPKTDKPDWLARVCVHRDAFDGTVFVFAENPESAWAFLYASQNPRWAVFLRLDRRDVILPAFEDMPLVEVMNHRLGDTREFNYSDPFAFDDSSTMPFPDDLDDVFVLCGVRFRRDGVLVGAEPRPFAMFAPQYFGEAAPRKKTTKAVDPGFVARLRAEHPWLTDEDIRVAFGKRKKKPPTRKARPDRSHSDDSPSDEEDSSPSGEDPEDSEDSKHSSDGDTEAELDALREERLPAANANDAFRIFLRGGKGTKKRDSLRLRVCLRTQSGCENLVRCVRLSQREKLLLLRIWRRCTQAHSGICATGQPLVFGVGQCQG